MVKVSSPRRRGALAIVATMTVTACASANSDSPDTVATATADITCSAFDRYGGIEGAEISVYAAIVSPEDQPYRDSFQPFEECTGAKVTFDGSREFEGQLPARLESSDPPDMAFVPQPGLIATPAASYPDIV